jgi:hypothetical protein
MRHNHSLQPTGNGGTPLPLDELNPDPLQKKDAMLELRQAASTKTSRATRLTYDAHLQRQDRALGDLVINQKKKP